ncbi:C6 zinc finger domain protein [Rutstroemia sp. NJR-2017a BBW]|nr:C6 zinc finger domain protein [Rutstroemia sp. NJR-2017a BBW]
MVGVPTSNRCDNCRIRKKKSRLAVRSKMNQTHADSPDQNASVVVGTVRGTNPVGNLWMRLPALVNPTLRRNTARARARCRLIKCTPGWGDSTGGVYASLLHLLSECPALTNTSNQSLYRDESSGDCISCKVKGDLMPLWLYGSFFQFIPARLGHNVALDDAVSCISSIYCDKSSLQDKSKSLVKYENYVRALRSLQRYLNDEGLSLQSETLCASILLQICELAVNADKGKWGDLSRGSAQLIQARGVDKYVDPFDHSMLESQLSYIVVQAIKSGKDCYLRQPQWRSLLATTSPWPDDVIYRKQIASLRLRVELCDHLQEIPALLADLYTLQSRHEGAPSRIELMGRALEAYDNMASWLYDCFDPHCALDFSETSPKSFRYPDIIAGVVDCVANTALLTLDKMICFLYHGNLPNPITTSLHHGDSEEQRTIQKWHQRAVCAFEYVRGESTIAAKPLEFGLRQFQSPNAICDNDDG